MPRAGHDGDEVNIKFFYFLYFIFFFTSDVKLEFIYTGLAGAAPVAMRGRGRRICMHAINTRNMQLLLCQHWTWSSWPYRDLHILTCDGTVEKQTGPRESDPLFVYRKDPQ